MHWRSTISLRIDTTMLSHVSTCICLVIWLALTCHNLFISLDNVSRVQMKATPLPGSDYINASFVDVNIL